jgi:CubicO group peptidase (beta-lactamase class C family)
MMRCLTQVATGVVALATSGAALGQELTLEQRVERADEYLTRMHDLGLYNGVTLIAKDDEILLAKGWGEADRATHRPWTVDTVSTIGSITKQFTGAAITLLNQQGKLEFTDTIGEYFPDAPADKAGITLHQLLTHSAGFPDGLGQDEDYVGREEYLALAWAASLQFAPGETYEYSNVGYSILAAVIEKVSGERYEAFVRENLFLPSGMTKTGYTMAGWSGDELATGYRDGAEWGTVVERQSHDEFSWHLVGNGGIHSTARDMHKWWLSIRNNTVLDAAHTKAYLAPHQDEGGGASFYGYGWVNFEGPHGERMISHNGGNGIFAADCAFFPEEDIFIFGMVNDAPATNVDSRAVFESMVGGELLMPPDPFEVDIEEVNAMACERALAWVEALNAGPDAYVRYGFDHRIDEGEDEVVNAQRRESAVAFHERWGDLKALDCEDVGPGQVRVSAHAANGDLLRISVTVAPNAPFKVVRIGISVSESVGAPGQASAQDILERAADLADMGMPGDAAMLVAQLVEREPENGRAWFQLGYFRLIAGDNDASVEPFEKAIALDFQPAAANYNLACANAKEGRTEAALDALEAAVAAGYDNVHGMFTDRDLKSIRDDARFKAIAEKARGG